MTVRTKSHCPDMMLDTGDLKWETIRSGRPVNSSPVLANFDGQPQLLINGNPNISAFDPVTGKELWSLPGVSGDVAPSLAVNSKMVFAAQDYFNVIALKPGKAGSTVWQDNTFTPDASSPVANDKFLFIATGSGDVACYDSEKGDTLWSHYFEEPFYASPIIADDNVYLLDRAGVMHIVKAGSEFQLDCRIAYRRKDRLYTGFLRKNNIYPNKRESLLYFK